MQLLHDYIIALVNLYGIVHKEKVIEIYNEQNDDAIDLNVMEKVIQDDGIKLEEDFVFIEGDYFVQESIYIDDELNEALSKRAGKPFYIPSKKELLKYKDEFYFEKTKQYNALLRYVQKNFTDGNRSEAVEISEEAVYLCQVEVSPSSIFNQLTNIGITFENEKQVGELLDLIMDLANNSRLWVNNGFTPNELGRPTMNKLGTSKRDQAQKSSNMTPKRKVGRNEPCPCGSGKKFKKCCAT